MAPNSLIPQTQIPALLASFLPDCSANGDSFLCKELSLLHLLYVLGAVLAVILVIVILFAIRAWHSGRNSNEIPQPKQKQERHHD